MGLITSPSVRLTQRFFLPLVAVLTFAAAAGAQVVIAPAIATGDVNPVSPEPTVLRPDSTPCKVSLFTNAAFNSSTNLSYTYTPPAACPGPWAKVVFSADFTVAGGAQLARSTEFFIGNAMLFRGTTGEPSAANPSPSWHVESDVTDLSAILNATQPVIANVNNSVSTPYPGVVYANAELDFYPVSATALVATVPNEVLPLVQTASNPVQSFTTSTPLTASVTLPTNTTQLYLDVVAQTDEFWWLSTPNAQIAPYVNNTDQTALREIEVSIDGTPAGIVPNHPYIYTDGLDPDLWRPIVGSQALALKPYRINLTPFAGILEDGAAHTIVINDINTQGLYYPSANLLVYTDAGAATVTGAVTGNTLTVNPGINAATTGSLDSNGYGTASVDEAQTRNFTITGYITGSAGKITTKVAETVNFENLQQLTNSATLKVIEDTLTSTVDSTVTTTAATAGTVTTANYHTENPLEAFITTTTNTDGTKTKTTTAHLSDVDNQSGPGTFSSNSSESVMSTDTIALDASNNVTSNSGQASTGTYTSTDSLGNNYSSTLTAANNVLTGASLSSTSTGSTLFVSASATTIAQGANVTLTVTAIPTNSALVPTGRITFYAGMPGKDPGLLSIVNLSFGTKSVIIDFLPVGVNTITATYDGDANFLPEASMNVVTVTVTPVAGSFTVGPASPTSVSVTPGASAIVSVPVTSGSSFTGTVALTCSGAPTGSTCVINPSSVALVPSTGSVVSSQTVSVVLTTTAASAENRLPSFPGSTAGGLGGISIAGLFFMFLPRRRSKSWKSLTLTALAICGLGLCSVAALTGCGSGSTKAPTQTGTPAGSYTITVTGTSGTVTSSTTFALTVN